MQILERPLRDLKGLWIKGVWKRLRKLVLNRDSYGFLKISGNSYGFLRILMEFLRIPKDFYGFLRIPKDS